MLRIVSRILDWTGAYKRRIYVGFVFAFISGLFMTMPVVLAANGLGVILRDLTGAKAITGKDIFMVLGLMIIAVIGRFIFSYLRSLFQDTVGYERLAEQRIKIGNILKRVPLGFFHENSTGELVSAVTTDLSFMELHAMNMVDRVVNGYITIIAMICFLLYYSKTAAVIAVAGLLLSALFLYLMGRRSRVNSLVNQTSQDTMIAATIEYLRGIALVKSFNQEGVTAGQIRSAYQKSKDINIKIEKEYASFNLFHILSLKAAAVVIIAVSAYQSLTGGMPLETLVFLAILSFVIFSSAENLSGAAHVLEVINNTLDKLEKIEGADFIDEQGKNIHPETMDIEFQDVSFAYEKKRVVNHVSCSFKQGSVTAIVGPSGSGKTTMCNLINRFYDVNQGAILLGGHDIREFTCDSLLKQTSMVFQNVYLFNETIADNIKFGKPDATYDEIVAAAKKARCHDFIMKLPQQYDTVVDESGASLSGGEKQRISIARAILKDAPIIILDEATSSIDPENEFLIQQALTELTRGKTVITIAHRLATIENADNILVMDEGYLVQQGKHNQLIEEEGIYKNFISIRKNAEGWTLGTN